MIARLYHTIKVDQQKFANDEARGGRPFSVRPLFLHVLILVIPSTSIHPSINFCASCLGCLSMGPRINSVVGVFGVHNKCIFVWRKAVSMSWKVS